MAEQDQDRNREDLTEEASPYRIEEFRRRGQVAQSREVTGLAALLAAAVVAYALSPKIGAQMTEYMREVFRADITAHADLGSNEPLKNFLAKALRLVAVIGLPISLAGFVIGALASFAQVGSIFSSDPIQPDISRVNPISGLRRIFSMRQVIEGLKTAFKTIVLLLVAYALIKSQVFKTPGSIEDAPGTRFWRYGEMAKVIFLSLAGILAVFAALDFGFQRWEFSKKLRLTKQEAKQEHKEREGDPAIKARIRAVQREMARRRMMQAVKKADVVVTNPTHIAVALVYDREKMQAPRVVAKGADFLAQKIRKAAADAGVPMVENVPLARALYKSVKMNQYVPRALYQAVAEVLAYVYRLKNRSFS